MGATVEIARHVERIGFKDLPFDVVEQAKRLIFDYFGVSLAGSRAETSQIVWACERRLAARGDSTVIGHGDRIASPAAAYVNAVSAHSIEMDDIDPLALFHTHPPVVSAVLAVAEAERLSGRAFLTAVCVGWEVMARLSLAANPSLRDRGFHTTPTCGTFGAAAGAAKALGLNDRQVASALGLAGAHASGLMEMYGSSMQKRINPAPAAAAGVRAALLARDGFTGADTILEGERGFLRAFADRSDVGPLLSGLGESFPMAIEFKRYACARPIHSACDAALRIRSETGPLHTDAVQEVVVARHPAWAEYHVNASPRNMHEAQVSLPYSVAVALIEGDAFLPQFEDAIVTRPDLQAMCSMVRAEADATLPTTVGCRMTVRLASGAVHICQVDHPSGAVENPLAYDALIGKAKRLSPEWTNHLDRLAEQLSKCEDVTSVTALTDCLNGPQGSIPTSPPV